MAVEVLKIPKDPSLEFPGAVLDIRGNPGEYFTDHANEAAELILVLCAKGKRAYIFGKLLSDQELAFLNSAQTSDEDKQKMMQSIAKPEYLKRPLPPGAALHKEIVDEQGRTLDVIIRNLGDKAVNTKSN